MMMSELTYAQHCKLDRIAKEDPGAKVINWSIQGPVIRKSTGKLNIIKPDGRQTVLTKITKEMIGA